MAILNLMIVGTVGQTLAVIVQINDVPQELVYSGMSQSDLNTKMDVMRRRYSYCSPQIGAVATVSRAPMTLKASEGRRLDLAGKKKAA